jgi:peptidyl-prolyl cis-trans isomerase B (cyclophilin B)
MANEALVTQQVFLDIEIDGKAIGRIVIGLFGEITPLTAQNFYELCTHSKGFGYKGSKFHRVMNDFMCQGGDITNGDGSGGLSIYGDSFPDENFELGHYGPGWLSMANAGVNTNSSQFFITFIEASFLNGIHTVFGKVLEGLELLPIIEDVPTNGRDCPKKDIVIADCGALETAEPFLVRKVEEELS